MILLLRGLTAFILVASLAGCVPPTYKAMDASLEAKVSSSDAVVDIKQPEIYAAIISSNGGGGGLIGAMIGSAIDNHHTTYAEKTIAPLRNALLDFDFNTPLVAGMQAELPKVTWLHLGKVTLTHGLSPDATDQLLTNAPTPYTLLVTVDYHLSADFDQLVVSAHALLMQKPVPQPNVPGQNPQPQSPSNPLYAVYANTVVYTTSVPDGAVDQLEAKAQAAAPPPPPGKKAKQALSDDDASIQYWSAGAAAAAKAALTQATADMSRLLVLAMQNPNKQQTIQDTVKIDHVKGHVLEQEGNGREVLQLDDGTIRSADVSEVERL